ncbi:hypothetical protein LWI29_014699 [Acer saccharum]|uniref:3'-5' exonuclease domain-containing protein n=1 Tax=Acer saccharum TaxID=4024 RepID=A0AA39W3D3_ACESA|nr:hypothetical protein LWI29_014699 [Acer saccharum]
MEIQGAKVKASLIDNVAIGMCNGYIYEVEIQGAKVDIDQFKNRNFELLVLCGWNRCLIIQLYNFGTFPKCLHKFLADETICFVGNDLYDKVGSSHYLRKFRFATDKNFSLSFENIVKVGDLAAKILKNPKLSKCRLAELAGEVEVNPVAAKASNGTSPTDWKTIVFTDEEIKCIILDAYTCCDIGNKMLRMVA